VPEMKKPSEVFSSIRYAKGKSKDKPHASTDNEEHYTVGEKEYDQQVKHVKKMAMQEQSDTMEKVEMVKSQLHFIKYACKEILEYIDMGGEVEEWYQVKVAKSFSEFESLHAFMEGESRRKGMKEEVEQLDELSPSTVSSYKTQAQKSIQQLKPHAEKGEYRDIAKNIMQRRQKGLAAAMKREEVEQLDEKNVPTNPGLWSRAKALARSKFDVYPSAYANGWASKWYKGKGGGWRSVSEEVDQIEEINQETKKNFIDRQKRLATSSAKTAQNPVLLAKLSRIPGYTDAMNLAKKTTAKEEVDQIDELSRNTLNKYVSKAIKQHPANPEHDPKNKKITQRVTGLRKATSRLYKEEQIDELSKSTLASYATKAADQARVKKDAASGYLRMNKGRGSSGEIKKSAEGDKRIEGVKSAIKRLAKEETLDEVSDATLSSYKEKAKTSADKLESEKKYGLALKRRTGILHATSKMMGRAGQKIGQLAKEEVEQIDEMNMSPHKQAVVAAGGGTPADQGIYAAQKEKPPFEGGAKPKEKVVPGKHGKGYSTARHLARMAMKKQVEKMKKAPMKEETRKAAIVKDIMKKKTEPDDKFQANPTLTSQVQKVDNAVT